MQIIIFIKKEITAFAIILLYFNCIKHPQQTNFNRICFIIIQYYTQMYFNKNKPNIHDNIYSFITCIIYQVSIIPSSEQYFEEISFPTQAYHE